MVSIAVSNIGIYNLDKYDWESKFRINTIWINVIGTNETNKHQRDPSEQCAEFSEDQNSALFRLGLDE